MPWLLWPWLVSSSSGSVLSPNAITVLIFPRGCANPAADLAILLDNQSLWTVVALATVASLYGFSPAGDGPADLEATAHFSYPVCLNIESLHENEDLLAMALPTILLEVTG